MRILFITNLYPILDSEKRFANPIVDFVQSLEAQGHEVRVIRPNWLISDFINKKTYCEDGFYENVENLNYILPFWGNVKNKIRTLFAPDIIIAHSLNGIIFADKLGCNFTSAIYPSDIKILKLPLYFYFRKKLEKALKKSQRIACPTIRVRDEFLDCYSQYKRKTFVAPCGVSSKDVIKSIWLEEEKDKIRILTCAEFLNSNSMNELIKACESIERVELTVLGAYKVKIEKLPENVVVQQDFSYQELIQKMRESEIFFLPAKKMNFENIYLDAMANGCITVCKNDEGYCGIIKDSVNGFVCGDIEETLMRVLEFPDKNWILNNSYETVLKFSRDKVATHYMKCLAINSSKI